MIKICLSGLSGSGKTAIGEEIAHSMHIAHITKASTSTYKKFVQDKEYLEHTSKVAETADAKYANDFDREIEEMSNKSDCVISTWLSPWIISNPTVRVWLNASLEARAERRASTLGISKEKAMKIVEEKDRIAKAAFMDVYKIDVMDHSIFDIEINTEKVSIKESAKVIEALVKSRIDI
ncbi:MAG: AAA family ATPase [Candidatus Micrarchaeia archaeon]